MAYETGAATGVVDLVNKFATFIEANGWTRDDLSNEGTGRRYHAHRGLQFVNMRGYVNESPGANFDSTANTGVYSIAFNIGTGYSGATPWYNQAGVPIGTSTKYGCSGMTLVSGAITAYHFFAQGGGDVIYAVVERTSGIYTYIGFGLVTKYGTWTGGDFMFGGQSGVTNSTSAGKGFFGVFSFSNLEGQTKGYVKVDVDGETGWHWGTGGDAFSNRDTTKRYIGDTLASLVFSAGMEPNTHNGLTTVQPVQIIVERTASHLSTGVQSLIGEIPFTGLFNIGESIVPSQQITFGTDNYRVFPFFAKNSSAVGSTAFASTTHSMRLGWAIKE